MSFRRIVVAAFCLAATEYCAAAQIFDINLSDDAAMLTYSSAMGQQAFGHGQIEGSILFTDHDNYMGDVGFGVVGEGGSGSPGLMVGVSVKAIGVNTKRHDVGALALGGRFDFAPPPLPRLRFGGSLDYAPDIVTFMDGDRLTFSSIYLGYEIFRDTVAYLGYRNIKVNIKDDHNVTVDSGGYMGISFQF